MKEGLVRKAAEAPDMEKVNRYTRRIFEADEVYIFSLVLCDNEVDRDFERFSRKALEKLRPLFLGKTVLFDHQRSAAGQTARIYDTGLEEEPGRMTQGGEVYAKLTAKAYLPRTESNQEVIQRIESGMLKEVSVGCSVKRSLCSLCGKEHCGHQKGRSYEGQVCHRILADPVDAYECSFVAVPAQRAAGVTKHYEGGRNMDLEKCLEAVEEEGLRLTKSQAADLLEQVKTLKQQADWGVSYRDKLVGDVLKYSAVLQPELPRKVMESAARGLPVEELVLLAETYEKMAGRRLPLKPQLAPEQSAREGDNGAFRIGTADRKERFV